MKLLCVIIFCLIQCGCYSMYIDWQPEYEYPLVHISTFNCDEWHSGSGFVVSDDRIITAAHVVDDLCYLHGLKIAFGTNPDKVYRGSEIVDHIVYSDCNDLAVIHLRTKTEYYFKLCDDVHRNDSVVAVGYRDLYPEVMPGRVIRHHDGEIMVRGFAAHGYSGGPILNAIDVCVSGIVSQKYGKRFVTGASANEIKYFLDQADELDVSDFIMEL